MSDCMTFPNTVEEFMEKYKVVDTDQVYSNGTEFVPIFRMEQWFEHLQDAQEVQPDRMKLVQQAVNTIMSTSRSYSIRDRAFRNAARLVQCAIDGEAPDFEQIPEGDEMPSEPKWIPTSKKPDPDLPEEDMSGYFLVTLHTYGNIGFDMDEYEVKKMRWNRVNGWVLPVHSPAWIEEALTQDVLAWKPCPEPYREDGAE